MSEFWAMTSTESAANEGIELLRVDTRGRVRVSRERREVLLAEYDRSGMSGAAFAEWAGVKYPTFMSWVSGRRRERGKGQDPCKEKVSWVEAVIERDGEREGGVGNGISGELLIELGSGVRMRVADLVGAGLAAEVLRKLEGALVRC